MVTARIPRQSVSMLFSVLHALYKFTVHVVHVVARKCICTCSISFYMTQRVRGCQQAISITSSMMSLFWWHI